MSRSTQNTNVSPPNPRGTNVQSLALNPRGRNGRFVVDEGRVVKPASVQRRQTRLIAEQRKKEQLLKFIHVFIRRGNDHDFIPASRDGPMDTLLSLIFPPAWRMTRTAREAIVRRFVYGGTGGPQKSKELPRPRVTDPVTNFSDRVFVYRKVRFATPNSDVEMNAVRGFLQTLKGENILPYASVEEALVACDDVLKSYKKISPGVFGYCGFPKKNTMPTLSKASVQLAPTQPFAVVNVEPAAQRATVAAPASVSALRLIAGRSTSSTPTHAGHGPPVSAAASTAEHASLDALAVVSRPAPVVPSVPISSPRIVRSVTPAGVVASVSVVSGSGSRPALAPAPGRAEVTGSAHPRSAAAVVRTVTPGRFTRPGPVQPSSAPRVPVRERQKHRGSNGRFEAMDVVKPASIQRRRYRENMDSRKREELQKFVHVFIRRGSNEDFIPALRDGPLDKIVNIVFAPTWRANLHVREKVLRRWVHGGSGGPQRTKDLPRPRVTDPETNYSERMHVYRKVRFPNAASEFEMNPVECFLKDLKAKHMLASESVQQALLACEDVFKSYKEISPGVLGYCGFPIRHTRKMQCNESEEFDPAPPGADDIVNGEPAGHDLEGDEGHSIGP